MDTSRLADTLRGGETNVGQTERIASAVGGGVLLLAGLLRRGPVGGLLALAGSALVHRGVSGHCAVYAATGVNTADQGGVGGDGLVSETRANGAVGTATAGSVPIDEDDDAAFGDDVGAVPPTGARETDHGYEDRVDEASDESFPASDPPSFNPGDHLGGPRHGG